MRRIIFSIFLAMLFCLVIAIKLMAVEYPAFVFGHWVWEDEGTSQSLRDLVKGYRERGIPVSAVIIDSPWETSYNSFEFDRGLYPDYEDLLSELEGQGISVILWITCAVNQADPDYEYALENGYFAPGLEEVSWWKGVGGLIDYENPEALNWWHERMNNVMALPFDGWKADGIDGIIALKGLKKRQRYAEKYYSDFYHYTRERTGRNTVIMARGIEIFNEHTLSLPGWVNPFKIGLPLRYAPREVSFATWMGDQDPTWNGMRTAYRSFRKSAEEGYLVPGFDIFGYREGEKDKEVFLRWAQWGAFSPLMENGGIAEHRPWEYDEETVEIYRHYAIWHEELGWYLYTAADERFKEGLSLVEPLRKGYLLGHDIYVQPIMRPGKRVSIELPQDCWRDWNHLENRYCSGKKIGLEYGISEFPAFIREGSLLPLWVRSEYTGHRLNKFFTDQNTLLVLPGEGTGTRNLIYLDGHSADISWNRDPAGMELLHEGPSNALVMIVEGVKKCPDQVIISDRTVQKLDCEMIKPESRPAYCTRDERLWIKLDPCERGFSLKVRF